MQRASFLGSGTETLVNYDWQVIDLGRCEISFGVCQNTATYVNASGAPTPAKVRDLDRLLGIVKEQTSTWPARVLQVGSSDGFTLSRYRGAGSQVVRGIDPSPVSRNFAKRSYGVETLIGNIETVQLEQAYDHVVLTHVLEHLYDPRICLAKCHAALEADGSILVEVPLWEWMERQPLGVLTFEHLNYFCEETLVYLLRSTGFEPVFVGKYAAENHYPVITVFAKKSTLGDRAAGRLPLETRVFDRNRARLAAYLEHEAGLWEKARLSFLRQCVPDAPVYLYGAGIHTAQMLAHSVIPDAREVAGLFDSSPTKWGKRLGEWTVQPGEAVSDLPPQSNVVVSSYASEGAIARYLENQPNPLNVIRLHNDPGQVMK